MNGARRATGPATQMARSISPEENPMGTARSQGPLWGTRARDWAEVQEGFTVPLYEAILDQTGAGDGTSVLDIGCGSGIFCELASRRGAQVSGIDAAESLLAIARARVTDADFRTGEMEELPYWERTFDLVTGFSSFQFAAHPVKSVREAAACRARDWWPSRSSAGVKATSPLPGIVGGGSLAPAAAGHPRTLCAFRRRRTEAVAEQAGDDTCPEPIETVPCPWRYPDEETTLRGLLSSGPTVGHRTRRRACGSRVVLNVTRRSGRGTGG